MRLASRRRGTGSASFLNAIPIALLVAGWLATPAFAQISSLRGRVTDPQGAIVVGASVRAARDDGSAARRTVTGPEGEYRFDPLPAGVFALEVEKAGFRRSATLVTVAAHAPATHDVTLSVAGIDDAVVVTASGRPQAAHEASKAVSIVDAKEIHARDALTLSEIVRFIPGVQVRDQGGPGQLAQMRIRGLRPDAAAVLVDGLRFRDAASLQGDVTSFLSDLRFVAADRVEVLRGSGSSLYGTNAVGGVVNIVSREGGGPFRAELQTEAGSLGQFRTRGSMGGSALDARLSSSAGALQENVLDGLDGEDGARSTGGQGRVRYQLGRATSLSARLLASSDRVELNASPSASSIPVANVPDSTIVDAVAVPTSAVELANAGGPLVDRRRHLRAGTRRCGQPEIVGFPHDRAAVPARAVRVGQLAGELPARGHLPHLHERPARRRLPARRQQPE